MFLDDARIGSLYALDQTITNRAHSSPTMATPRLAARHLLSTSRTLFHAKHRSLFTSRPAPTRTPLRTGLYATVFTLSAGLFAVYYFDARSALHRYLITPVLRYGLDAETGHKLAVKVLRSGLGPRDLLVDDERLRSEVRDNWIMYSCC
jgi:dihydroorotate dehydrogenase